MVLVGWGDRRAPPLGQRATGRAQKVPWSDEHNSQQVGLTPSRLDLLRATSRHQGAFGSGWSS